VSPNISFLKVKFWKFDIAMKGLWGCTKNSHKRSIVSDKDSTNGHELV
jgi:hypothetical protein